MYGVLRTYTTPGILETETFFKVTETYDEAKEVFESELDDLKQNYENEIIPDEYIYERGNDFIKIYDSEKGIGMLMKIIEINKDTYEFLNY